MATISTDSAGRRIIQVFDANGKRWAIRLGKVTMDVARDVKRHVEILAQAQITNSNIKDETARWLAGAGAKLYARLQVVGLVGAKSAVQSHRLEPFMAECIEARSDLGVSARKNLGLASRVIVKFFGDCQLRSVTAGDADQFAIRMKRDYAGSTAARMVKWARQFFGMALRQEKISKNPFDGVRLPSNDATDRIAFVDLPTAYTVLNACPDAEWRLLFALRWHHVCR